MDKEKIQEIEKVLKEIEGSILNFPNFSPDEIGKYEDYVKDINEKIVLVSQGLEEQKPVKGSSITLERMVNRVEKAQMQLHMKSIDKNMAMSKEELNNHVNESNAMITRKITEINREVSYFDKITRNLYNFFGIILGLVVFIFINFRLVSSATSLSLGKMIIYLGLSNIVLIFGIVIILNFLGFFFNGQKLLKTKALGIIGIVAIILSSTIIFAGEQIYLKEIKREKDTDNEIIIRQEALLKNMDSKLNIMGDKIDNLLKENAEKELKIENLQEEIETLKTGQK